MSDNDLEQLGINVIRGLAMDGPRAAKSGHSGTAMALAPLAHVLWTRVMKYDASAPDWPDRDRFVLSAGHASMLLYSMLYLTGFGLELADIQQFRQWASLTPGHPEYRHTKGVEITTGPLGQGFGNAVGFAIDEKHLRADAPATSSSCLGSRREPRVAARRPAPRPGAASLLVLAQPSSRQTKTPARLPQQPDRGLVGGRPGGQSR